MTRKEFDLLDAINSEGLDNSEWGIYMGYATNSKNLFGTKDDFVLEQGSMYIVIWLKQDNPYSFVSRVIERYHDDFYEVLNNDTDFYIFKCD